MSSHDVLSWGPFQRPFLIPSIVWNNTYAQTLANNVVLNPPQLTRTPAIPTYEELTERNCEGASRALAVPVSPIMGLYLPWLAYITVWLTLLVALPQFVSGALTTLILTVSLAVGLISAWWRYVRWYTNVYAVAAESLTLLRGFYPRTQVSQEGSWISSLAVQYRYVRWFWRFIGIGSVRVVFSEGDTDVFRIRDIGSPKPVHDLIFGIQSAVEKSQIRTPDLLEEQNDLLRRQIDQFRLLGERMDAFMDRLSPVVRSTFSTQPDDHSGHDTVPEPGSDTEPIPTDDTEPGQEPDSHS